MDVGSKSSPIGKLALNDWTKGLLVAVVSAILTVIYDGLSRGVSLNWPSLKPTLLSGLSVGLTAGIAYILKNLSTGSGGQLLTNKPKEEVQVEKKP